MTGQIQRSAASVIPGNIVAGMDPCIPMPLRIRFFRLLWAMAEKATDGKMRNHCGGCHSPSGTASGTIKFDPKMGKHGGFTADPISEQGISCDICHTISGSNIQKTAVLEHGNTSIVLDPGKVKRSSLKNAKSPFHETKYSEHHASSKVLRETAIIYSTPIIIFLLSGHMTSGSIRFMRKTIFSAWTVIWCLFETAIRVADELKRPQDLSKTTISGFAGVMGPYRKVVHDHGVCWPAMPL